DCAAGNTTGSDTITLPTATFTFTASYTDVNGLNALPLINSTIIIDGNNAIFSRSSGAPSFRFMQIITGGNLTINNLTLTGGRAGESPEVGGAIRNWGTLTINDSTLSNNTSDAGGAIYNQNGTTTIANTLFLNNTSLGNFVSPVYGGGALHNNAGTLAITSNTIISANTSARDGSGIYSVDGILTINQADIYYNTGAGNGGGLLSLRNLTTITATTIAHNTATWGAGLYNESDFLSLTRSTIAYNQTLDTTDGGGLYLRNSDAYISNSTFSQNRALNDGGGIYIHSGAAFIENSTIYANQADSGAGGGIFRFAPDFADIYNTIVASSTLSTDCSGGVGAIGTNLDTDGTCGASITADPNLGPLGYHNSTILVHPLLIVGTVSPALDAGTNAVCNNSRVNNIDQRGVSRTNQDGNEDGGTDGNPCDLGAYERQLTDPTTITLGQTNTTPLTTITLTIITIITLATLTLLTLSQHYPQPAPTNKN
ncbi:MAG TPA: choice-of-anchor Q domain-containing protein, partial [Anaerolineae bacterium]|nr:choice-of-anchor Q domain-containing protein [Anaerolineae bacterium]